MLNQLIVDMRSQLKGEHTVAAAIADEKRLSAQVDTEKKAPRTGSAGPCWRCRRGGTTSRKQALLRHNEHAQGAVQLHETWVKHARRPRAQAVAPPAERPDRGAKRKKNILIARQKRARRTSAFRRPCRRSATRACSRRSSA